MNDSVTITFDATLGSGDLVGVDTVYAHTGVITEESICPTDWLHKPALWSWAPDSLIAMTKIGPNLHEITFHVKSFYGLSSKEILLEMAFVFRNGSGSLTGKNADGSDIYVHCWQETGFDARMVDPLEQPILVDPGETLDFNVLTTQTADLIRIYHEGILAANVTSSNTASFSFAAGAVGKYKVWFEADNGDTVITDTTYYVVTEPPTVMDAPAGSKFGITYLSDTSVRLFFYAPMKEFVYVIGDFNDWEVCPEYQMNQAVDGKSYWLDIHGLPVGEQVRFQYFIDRKLKIADPYSEMILDPWHDPVIPNSIYPDLIDYPVGKTTRIASVMETAQEPYPWVNTSFTKPDNRDMVIYEMLIRDYIIRHDYNTAIDSLDHLVELGVNVIELMPPTEFEGNDSWGYNPSYFFAPDKWYGPRHDLKRFIDECHSRGIAVIFDVVFNHAFGQCPWVQMYYDADEGKVTPDNPWFNVEAKHPFNVGMDFNHSDWYVQHIVDSTMAFWVENYKVDGFRLDLSKGITQNYSDNVGDWGIRDEQRIGWLKGYADRLWSKHPGVWLILEHFANNDEEIELAGHGFMLWGNANHNYSDATMGWASSDFNFAVSHKARGWPFHNLVGFAESHDEERLMYNNLNFGNEVPGYSTKDEVTALRRMELGAAFLFTVPGPKMMWMFGELGYDFSINYDCRICPKPIRWDYKTDCERYRLFKTYQALIDLKINNSAFRTNDFEVYSSTNTKTIKVSDPSMDVVVIGNFDVVDQSVWPGFQYAGTWYNYFTGASISVSDPNATIPLGPGEWRIYTSTPLSTPDTTCPFMIIEGIEEPQIEWVSVYPNPFQEQLTVSFASAKMAEVRLEIFNLMGQKVATVAHTRMAPGQHDLVWEGTNDIGKPVVEGYYLYRLQVGDELKSGKVIFSRD